MIRLKQEGYSVLNYLRNRGFSSIAIYGFGRVGRILATEISELLTCVIDRSKELDGGGIEIRKPNANFNDIDLILISTISGNNTIKNYLENQTNCEIWTYDELIRNITLARAN